jgi:hypothetical protein
MAARPRNVAQEDEMKKLVTAALVLAVVLAIVVPAMARSTRATAPANGFTATGSVQNVIRSAGALRMQVDVGSQAVRPFIGGSLAVRVGNRARILLVTDGIARLIKLTDIHPGDPLAVSGWIDRSQPRSPVFIAQVIRIIDRTPTKQLTVFGCGGPVTAVAPLGTPMTLTLTLNSSTRALWDKLGTDLSVVVTPATEVSLKSGTTVTPITLPQVVVGQRAWVHGTIDRSQATPVFTATQITVQALTVPTPDPSPGG